MPCSVVNSQQNLQARLPTLPQSLPKTQAEWTAFLNSLGTSLQILKQETHPPNIIPQQLQTFGTSTASTSTAALSATNCTPSVDATQQFYGGASLKVVISASGATLAFAGFPIAIAAATRWFCAFQILATSGATGSLTVATSAGHSITENFTISSSAAWQGVWGLFDFRQFGDTQASWTFTFTSTATLWLDGLQMNAVGDPLTFLPKFNGVQLTSGTASTFTGTLDGIADGTTYARNLASYLVNGRPYSYKGLYSGTTTYNPGDEVNSNNNYYLCTALTTGNAPPNASFWQTLGPATLDALSDGSTYQRMPTANMDANRRGLIDFTQAGHLGKNFDNLLDGASRFAVTNGANLGGVASFDVNNRALIDFTQGGHLSKTLDNIGDGSTYARALAAYLKGGRPYNYQGAWNSTTTYHQGDEVSSGAIYYLALATNTNTPPPNASFWQPLGPVNLGSLPDGSGRFAVINGAGFGGVVSWDANNRALIDFAQGGHLSKNLGNIADDTGSGRFAQRWFYGPNSATAAWFKIGTWVAFAAPDALRLEYIGGQGYNTNAVQQSHATIIVRTGNDTAAPNLSGVTWWENGGTQAILAVKAAATGSSASPSNHSWEIYAELNAFAGGQWEAIISPGATFSFSGASVSDPGTASSILVVGTGGLVHNAGGAGLDAVYDGSTYGRHLLSGLTGGVTNTAGLVANAATVPVTASSGTATLPGNATSVSITTSGGAVLVTCMSAHNIPATTGYAASIDRDGSSVAGFAGAAGQASPCVLVAIDTPPAGSHTYALNISPNSGSFSSLYANIQAVELKR